MPEITRRFGRAACFIPTAFTVVSSRSFVNRFDGTIGNTLQRMATNHSTRCVAGGIETLTVTERDYVNIKTAAELLGVSRVTIWRWIRDGRLPVSRLGHRTARIKREDLSRLLENPGALALAEIARDDVAVTGEVEPPAIILDEPGTLVGGNLFHSEGLELGERREQFAEHATLVLEQLARDTQSGREEVAQALHAMAGQAQHLARLIGQVLDEATFEPAPMPAEELELADEPLTGDATRLGVVLASLLENVLRFEPMIEKIDVVVSLASPEVIELSVPECGADMPPGQRIQNFERFYRDHTDPTRTGFALSQKVSRQIAGLHGGEINSELLEDGSTRFVVRLPLRKSDLSD